MEFAPIISSGLLFNQTITKELPDEMLMTHIWKRIVTIIAVCQQLR